MKGKKMSGGCNMPAGVRGVRHSCGCEDTDPCRVWSMRAPLLGQRKEARGANMDLR